MFYVIIATKVKQIQTMDNKKIFETKNENWIKAAHICMWISIFYFVCIFSGIPVGDFNYLFFFISLWTLVFWIKNKVVWQKESFYKELMNEKEKIWWIEWTAGIFPLIFIFFLVRGFIIEPFKIPSGSMEPTFISGDIILVNKFYYNFKTPVFNIHIKKNNPVKAGDVIVFKYPPAPNIYYIKRVVATPGDKIEYFFQTRQLNINDKTVSLSFQKNAKEYDSKEDVSIYKEKLYETSHLIQLKLSKKDIIIPTFEGFLNKENCIFSLEKLVCSIPQGYYFAMGDNRDNSLDSRFWGFVPENNIIGHPQAILINFSNFARFIWF